MMMLTRAIPAIVAGAIFCPAIAQPQQFGQIQPRDRPVDDQDEAVAATESISGRVVASDTGLPLNRARVSARA